MPITHTNRQRKTYYLLVGKTKKGNPKYYFALSPKGTLVEQIPDGFEIHEHASGQVTLRRVREHLITDEELRTVERQLSKTNEARWSYAEKDGEKIVVYTAGNRRGIESTFLHYSPFIAQAKLDEIAAASAFYRAIFQFVLVDAEQRIFHAQRFCFLGSIDDWIFIGESDALHNLAREYLPHINQDSYYELM
jgi:hypothetical protein